MAFFGYRYQLIWQLSSQEQRAALDNDHSHLERQYFRSDLEHQVLLKTNVIKYELGLKTNRVYRKVLEIKFNKQKNILNLDFPEK
jgi:hypothetical protein